MRKQLVGLVVSQLLLLMLFPACGPIQPPKPPKPPAECPASCPLGTICTDPAKGCVAKPAPGPVCTNDVDQCGCFVMPPATGVWEEIFCPAGQICEAKQCVSAPAPVCPTCPAGFSCSDPAAGCVKDPVVPPPGPPQAPLISDEELAVVMCGAVPCEAAPSQTWSEVSMAINRWRALHSEKWNAAGTCLSSGPAGIDEAFLGISSELLRVSIVAGQSVDATGKRSDCTFVNRPTTDLYEEGHLFDYARACVATGSSAMKKLYRRSGETPPPVEPPPVAGCPAPVTPKVARWGLTFRNRWWDCTPQFYSKDTVTWTGVQITGYCAAIGMPERLFCPARQEGDLNRRACEGVGIGGYAAAVPLWRCEQGLPEINAANPFQARCDPGWIEVCATDGTSCTRSAS